MQSVLDINEKGGNSRFNEENHWIRIHAYVPLAFLNIPLSFSSDDDEK